MPLQDGGQLSPFAFNHPIVRQSGGQRKMVRQAFWHEIGGPSDVPDVVKCADPRHSLCEVACKRELVSLKRSISTISCPGDGW